MKNVYDKATKKYMLEHPMAKIMLVQCEKCGLFYRALLGYECQKKGVKSDE